MKDDPEYNPHNPHHSVTHDSTEHEIGDGVFLSSRDVWRAALAANERWADIEDIIVAGNSLLDALDQKVISGLVGEIFRSELAVMCDYLFSNPRDDGHPDLCVISDKAIRFLSEHGITLPNTQANLSKAVWTPYGGEANRLPGVEIKATVIGTPVKEKRGPRYHNAKRPSWSAHHQDTPVLLGLVWDYVDGLPKIVGAFFANSLDTSQGKGNQHWSSVSTPKDGSKGTSSCSLLREGCRLMYENQVLEPTEEAIKHKLGMATRTIRALVLLTKEEIREMIDEHGYQIPKNLTKPMLIQRFLNMQYNSLKAGIQSSDDQFEHDEAIAELLEQIGEPDFSPTDNKARNWLKLQHFFTDGTSNLDELKMKALWRLGHDPTNLLKYLHESMKLNHDE